MADELCPTCHSPIGTNSTEIDGRIQGTEGTDSEGNQVPFWSEDPVLTRIGQSSLNGDNYKGFTRLKFLHLREIQDNRKALESRLDIQPRTEFSNLDPTNDEEPVESRSLRRHIIELRESTEKILKALNISLTDYFRLGLDGEEKEQNPILVVLGANDPQDEWIDVERGQGYVDKDGKLKTEFQITETETVPSPTLPRARIRAIHIEDLRHPIPENIPSLLIDGVSQLHVSSQVGQSASFVSDVSCSDSLTNKKPLDPWFIDRDDDTIFWIRVDQGSSGLRWFQNEEPIDPNECPVMTTDFNLLETADPLPEDFEAASGSISRFEDKLSLFIEEGTPSRFGQGDGISSLQGTASPNVISRYDFINTENVGTSASSGNENNPTEGQPNQVFELSNIQTPTKGTPVVFVGVLDGEKWTVIDDIQTAGPQDKVFEYDPNEGKITFGDGINGAIPAADQDIYIRISIRNGGGVWKFAGIVNTVKEGINIGAVKSARDKILYAQTNISIIDCQQLLNVSSILNGVRTIIFSPFRFVNGGTALAFSRTITDLYWLGYGGTIAFSAGEGCVTLNSEVGENIQNAIVSNAPPEVSVNIFGEYPSWIATISGTGFIPPLDPDPSSFFNNSQASMDFTSITKTIEGYQDAEFTLGAIEIVNDSVTCDSVDGQSATLDFKAGGPADNIIIANNRVSRLIQIGDKVGSFENPVNNSQTIFGTSAQNSGSLLNLTTIAVECRQTNFQQLFLPMVPFDIPEFVCTWGFSPGNIIGTVVTDLRSDPPEGFPIIPLPC